MEVTPDEAAPESLPRGDIPAEGDADVSAKSRPACRNLRRVYGARRTNALLISHGDLRERMPRTRTFLAPFCPTAYSQFASHRVRRDRGLPYESIRTSSRRRKSTGQSID
jgi:hypothetical protein